MWRDMARKIDNKSLAGIYEMISPLAERVKFHYGTPPDDVVKFLLDASVSPPAHGALDCSALLKWVSAPDRSTKLNSSQFRFSTTIDQTTESVKDIENPRVLMARNSKGEFVPIKMLTALGASNDENYRTCPVTYLLSSMPYLNPAVGRSADIEIFLNYMPSYVLSRIVPYVDVEFQFGRPFEEKSNPNKLLSTGLMKFLAGGVQFNTPAQNANDVLALGHRIIRDKDTVKKVDEKTKELTLVGTEKSYAGMEIFTSPQTLVNPEQLDSSRRYKEIIDPFRPFMSMTSLNITVAPTVGYFTNKTGTLVLKLHDRSRLSEIGDLLQPEIYTRTTLWITYGWVHPNETDNPYATFVNNNLMTRELYGIKNAAYSFENDGQVTITLQLYTLGASEMMDLKVTAGPDPVTSEKSIDQIQQEMNHLFREIARLANKMGILGEESGGTADIRAYQIVNTAVRGEFPNLKETNVQKAMQALSAGLTKSQVDSDDAIDLLEAMQKLYAPSQKDAKKFEFNVKRENAVDKMIAVRFKQLAENDKDPWIPWTMPGASPDKNSPLAKNTFNQAELKRYETQIIEAKNKGKKANMSSGICSFAKLVSTFVSQQVAEAQIADEFQVFFYAFNESAGAASGQSIANFPIDLVMFRDQFSIFVNQNGSSKISIAEFLRFAIESQLHDPRSLGYGTRDYYKPFVKGEVATLDDKKKEQFESWMTAHQSKYGPFHIPTIEAHLEAIPLVSSAEEIVDMMSDVVLNRSAKEVFYNAQGTMRRYMKGRYALRLHIYDKQLNPYKEIETAIKPPSGAPGHYILISNNAEAADARRKAGGEDALMSMLTKLYAGENLKQSERSIVEKVFVPMDLSTNKKVKDYISSIVPTILVGANGSTITSAQLSTNQDALLSSVQMMKQSGRANQQTPAGAGPGGLPITVIPGQLQMTTLGCPMANLTQKYFVDFNTGTTADNIYCVSKLTHTFTPGKFETSWGFVWADAYGRIAGASDMTDYLKFLTKQIQKPKDSAKSAGEGNKKGKKK